MAGALPATQRDAKALLEAHADRHDWQVAFDEPAHDAFLALLRLHPRAVEKIGPGIGHFFRSPHPYTGGSIIRFRRIDLLEDDLDSRLALSARSTPTPPWVVVNPVYKAGRGAIAEQIEDLRRTAQRVALQAGRPGKVRCAVSGEWIDERDGQVDHAVVPFTILLASWLIRRGLDHRTLPTVSTFPEPGRRFSDDSLAEDWAAFHERHARLRLVSRPANRRLQGGRRETLVDLLAKADDPLSRYQRLVPPAKRSTHRAPLSKALAAAPCH